MTNLKLKDVLNCGKQSNIVATCEKQWSGMLKSLRISLLQIPSEQDSCCSVAKSRLTLQPHGLQHTRPPCPSPMLKLMSIRSVMPSNHLILCRPLLLLPAIFPSIRVFSNESVLQVAKVLELQLHHQSFQ